MYKEKKWSLLFIQDTRSKFDVNTPVLEELFLRVDKVSSKEETLANFDANSYDVVISDLSMEPENAGLLKQLKDKKPKQEIYALVSVDDSDKLYGIADMGINAFELTPEQLDQALEMLAQMDHDKGD